MIIVIVGCLIFTLALRGCIHDSIDGVIRHAGTYKLDNGYKLIIQRNNALIIYSMKNGDGDTIIKSGNAISDAQRWGMYWDKISKELWVLSSDIGDSVWMDEDGKGHYIEKQLDEMNAPSIGSLPKVVYDAMPSYREEYLKFLRVE